MFQWVASRASRSASFRGCTGLVGGAEALTVLTVSEADVARDERFEIRIGDTARLADHRCRFDGVA